MSLNTLIDPLPMAFARFQLAMDTQADLDWRVCAALRGFMGRQVNRLPKSEREPLFSVFHQQHDQSAPFRLVFEQGDPSAGQVTVRMITHGPNCLESLSWFADLLKNTSGRLFLKHSAESFKVVEISPFEENSITFPVCISSNPSPTPAVDVNLRSLSPCFFKSPAPDLFLSGDWGELLAIRYADLAEIRRQQVTERLPRISGECKATTNPYYLAFSGSSRKRTGHHFTVHFKNLGIVGFRMLELLCLIGLGKHCAYGAGDFSMRQIEDQPAHKNL